MEPVAGSLEEGNCVTNISHKFDGKGMEITSELRLKNLTHADIGNQNPNVLTFWSQESIPRNQFRQPM
jgi:hypothetical protein